jgi:hypothetical protein
MAVRIDPNKVVNYGMLLQELTCFKKELEAGADIFVATSTNDPQSGYLINKILAGTGITVTEVDDGGTYKLQLDSTGGLVAVSGNDTTPDYLEEKLVAGNGITLTVLNDGADEGIQIDSTGATTWYDAGNGAYVEATPGVTTTLVSGVLEFTVPADGKILHGNVEVDPADCVYATGVSGGLKLRFIYSGGTPRIKNMLVLKKSSSGASLGNVSSGNPLQIEPSATFDQRVDEYDTGVVGHVFQQLSTRASAGAHIVF